jgi:hypothetical protein
MHVHLRAIAPSNPISDETRTGALELGKKFGTEARWLRCMLQPRMSNQRARWMGRVSRTTRMTSEDCISWRSPTNYATADAYLTQGTGGSPYVSATFNSWQPTTTAVSYTLSGNVLVDGSSAAVVDTSAADYQNSPQYRGMIRRGSKGGLQPPPHGSLIVRVLRTEFTFKVPLFSRYYDTVHECHRPD